MITLSCDSCSLPSAEGNEVKRFHLSVETITGVKNTGYKSTLVSRDLCKLCVQTVINLMSLKK